MTDFLTDLAIDVFRVLIIGIVQVSQSVDKKEAYMLFVIFPSKLKNSKSTILLCLSSTL
ncbi:hypothetical protein BCR42DRAFT_427323 [Absidia repens]|uniref:Uncharacterized protein n=1 Tax=Absidia repens TaxID=90262 RepID=A0A1X2HZR5_9FUNG|nr:hypothetical protein BCR42DRAFT_427323 [Absidia repens]